ncbi:MAG TPA: response regulator transcription factor [Microlunatus sp.]
MPAELPTRDQPQRTDGGAGTTPVPVTVLIVDDHPVVRHGLAALLADEAWAGRVVEASGVAEAARLAIIERPRLAVVDLQLPDGTGLALIARLRTTVPDCAIVVLTLTTEGAAVDACLHAGARGYLRKDSPPQALLPAFRTVAEGGTVLGPGVGAGALGSGTTGELSAPLNRLSPRDLTMVRLLGEGRSNSEIARQINVSEKTVRNRLSTIYSVLGVADRVQAALLAREKGLLDTRER